MSAADLLRLAAQSPQARAFPAAKDRSDGSRDRRNTGRRGRRPTRETDLDPDRDPDRDSDREHERFRPDRVCHSHLYDGAVVPTHLARPQIVHAAVDSPRDCRQPRDNEARIGDLSPLA
ncbi:MAG TPA: hypothetical protein DIU07_17885 [Rhodobacteraceae bacterium]|nr:hypothetical protein [Paracoccaceae bacterium]